MHAELKVFTNRQEVLFRTEAGWEERGNVCRGSTTKGRELDFLRFLSCPASEAKHFATDCAERPERCFVRDDFVTCQRRRSIGECEV